MRATNRLPQSRILPRRCQAEILVGAGGRDTAARSAIEEPRLNEEGLVDILDGVLLLVNRRGQAVHANRTAVELVDDRAQQVAIDLIESLIIDLEQLQGIRGHGHGNPSLRADLGEVADAAKATVGDAWRTA